MSVKLKYGDIALGADDRATAVSHSAEVFCDLSKIPYGTDDANIYAALESGLWALDGSVKVRRNEVIPFWSAEISDENGDFSTVPSIAVTLSQQISSSGITIIASGDCLPSKIRLRWMRGAASLETMEIVPSENQIICNHAVENYDGLVVEILGTALPFRRARIDCIMFGINRTFTRETLSAVQIIQEIDPSSRMLAAGILDFDVFEKNVDFIFQRKQVVTAYDGDRLMGVFYLKEADRKTVSRYGVECTDIIGLMDDEPYPDTVFQGVTAYEAAVQICRRSTVYMDDGLKSIPISGTLKGKSYRQALQQLCLSICAVATTWGTDGIIIRSLPELGDAEELNEDRIRVDASMKKRDIITMVRVTSHSYSRTGSGTPIRINGEDWYDTEAVVSIVNPDTSEQDQNNVIEVKDGTLISPERAGIVADHIMQHGRKRGSMNFKFRLDSESIGDAVSVVTPWNTRVTGHIVKASIVLSGIMVSDTEVVG